MWFRHESREEKLIKLECHQSSAPLPTPILAKNVTKNKLQRNIVTKFTVCIGTNTSLWIPQPCVVYCIVFSILKTCCGDSPREGSKQLKCQKSENAEKMFGNQSTSDLSFDHIYNESAMIGFSGTLLYFPFRSVKRLCCSSTIRILKKQNSHWIYLRHRSFHDCSVRVNLKWSSFGKNINKYSSPYWQGNMG